MKTDDLLSVISADSGSFDFEEIIFSNQRVELLAFKGCADELTLAEKKEFSEILNQNSSDAVAYLKLKRLNNINDIRYARADKKRTAVLKNEYSSNFQNLKKSCEKIFVNKIIILHLNLAQTAYLTASSEKNIGSMIDFRLLHKDKNCEIAVYFFEAKTIVKILLLKKKNKDFNVFLNSEQMNTNEMNNEIIAEIAREKLKSKNILIIKAGAKKIETEILICGK